MYSLGAIGIVLLAATAIWSFWYGWRDRRDPARPRRRAITRIPRTTQLRLLAGLVAGSLAWITTGWFLLVPLAAAAALFVPKLIGRRAADREIARLTALEEWLRTLVGVLDTGKGLEQAIILTRKSIPRELEPELSALTARLATGVDTQHALDEFADSLDDATGDLVVSALKISAKLRASGLPKALSDFADSVAEDVRDRRQVEVDRRGPRTQARLVTLIVIGFLIYLFAATDYMDPYRAPGLQLVLAGLLAGFAGLLLYMRHLTRPIRPPRFLRDRTPEQPRHWWTALIDPAATPPTRTSSPSLDAALPDRTSGAPS
ncbi:type II secretion system F family protein [Nocardia transvalensis]|uniref:type II secretion system F family protein n=1 Tax=Nocardia transvalensis TaxID=37333 RepID=UPI001895D84E|nr:type II secretion system F family protein [Nocardia transvalensis]MBF6333627.1 type II secretion system F family protein [Nocardia transvalensis]